MEKFKHEKYISQRQLKSGIWTFFVQIYTDNEPIRKNFCESDYGSPRVAYDMAVAFKQKVLYELQENIYFKPIKLTLYEVFQKSEDVNDFALKTNKNHKSLFNKHIKNHDLDISKFDADFAINVLNSMTSTENNENISRVFRILNNIDETAVLKGCYKSLRLIGVKKPKSKAIKKIKEYKLIKSKEVFEIIKLLENIKGVDGIVFSGAVAISLYTGMRPGEILALQRNDIKNNYIYINKAVCSSKDEEITIGRCKNDNAYRKIPIAKDLSKYINKLLKLNGNYLIPNEDTFYYDDLITKRINSYIKPKKFNFYQCRHLFQTDLEFSGIDRPTIDALVGHGKKTSTDIYLHTNDKLLEKAIENRKFDASII